MYEQGGKKCQLCVSLVRASACLCLNVYVCVVEMHINQQDKLIISPSGVSVCVCVCLHSSVQAGL